MLEGDADERKARAHDLETFLRQVEIELASEYTRISNRATEDPGTAGDQGEENWAAFLRGWLPPAYRIVTKGRILSIDGEASPQLDVLVLKPSYPPALYNKKLYLAGGVAAAFECKTTLKKSHLVDAIATAKLVQRLADPEPPRSTRQGTPYLELHGAIFFGVLAHSHTWSASTAVGHVSDALNNGLLTAEHPRNVIDAVCVSNLANWSSMRMSYSGPKLNSWQFDPMKDQLPEGYTSCTIMAPPNPEHWPEQVGFPEIPIAQLCAQLMSRLAWEDPSLRTVADYFRLTGLQGRASGRGVGWPLDTVYSPAVSQRLFSGPIGSNLWDPWSLVFL